MTLSFERLQEETRSDIGLREILWDCGWNKEHRLATLSSLRYWRDNQSFFMLFSHSVLMIRSVVADHPEVLWILRDRTVVFGRYSGVSLEGHIVFFTGEVRANWVNVIKRVPTMQV